MADYDQNVLFVLTPNGPEVVSRYIGPIVDYNKTIVKISLTCVRAQCLQIAKRKIRYGIRKHNKYGKSKHSFQFANVETEKCNRFAVLMEKGV